MAEPDEILDILFVASDDALAELYKLKLELDGYRVKDGQPSAGAGHRPAPPEPGLH